VNLTLAEVTDDFSFASVYFSSLV